MISIYKSCSRTMVAYILFKHATHTVKRAKDIMVNQEVTRPKDNCTLNTKSVYLDHNQISFITSGTHSCISLVSNMHHINILRQKYVIGVTTVDNAYRLKTNRLV